MMVRTEKYEISLRALRKTRTPVAATTTAARLDTSNADGAGSAMPFASSYAIACLLKCSNIGRRADFEARYPAAGTRTRAIPAATARARKRAFFQEPFDALFVRLHAEQAAEPTTAAHAHTPTFCLKIKTPPARAPAVTSNGNRMRPAWGDALPVRSVQATLITRAQAASSSAIPYCVGKTLRMSP